MASVNKATLLGNLGRDPETRTLQDGNLTASLSIATSESWKDKATGERREKVEWHRVSIFNDALARVAQQYLRKGSRVYVEGQIQTRKWTDRDQIERYTTEIVVGRFNGAMVLLDSRPTDGSGDISGRDSGFGTGNSSSSPSFDDEIPL